VRGQAGRPQSRTVVFGVLPVCPPTSSSPLPSPEPQPYHGHEARHGIESVCHLLSLRPTSATPLSASTSPVIFSTSYTKEVDLTDLLQVCALVCFSGRAQFVQ